MTRLALASARTRQRRSASRDDEVVESEPGATTGASVSEEAPK